MKEFYPKVSIIIPVYNGKKYLKYAIESALNQTYKNIEIIVVDDGSTDNTRMIAKKYEGKIKYYYKENGGVSSALNLGITKMSGEYFSWLSHDDEYYPNKIEEEVTALTLLGNKNIIVYSNYALMTPNGKVYNKVYHDHQRLEKFQELAILKGCINGLTLLIPKEAFKTCGKFNENLYCTQDYDKWLEMIKKYKFYHVPNVLTKTRIHESQTTNTSPKVIDEGIVLWKKILNSLSEDRINEIFGDVLSYYQEMYVFFKMSPYQEMADFCEEKILSLTSDVNSSVRFNPLVSIIIPVFNGSNYISTAIESALNQTYENIEIIVVDDGSNDDGKTAKAVSKYENKVKYYYKANGGVASALNFGIKKASGEYISWLSHDDVYNPQKIKKQITYLKYIENKNTIIFSNFELIDKDGKILSSTEFDKMYSINQLQNSIFPVLKGATNGCTMLISKQIFLDNDMFNEKLKTTNDYEMWFRLFEKYPIKFICDPLIKYRIHDMQDTKTSDKYYNESITMWTSFFNSIDSKKIKKLGFQPIEFYFEFYIQMLDSGYKEVADLLYDKFLSLYKKQKPNVSVIMPCYNSEKHLSVALDSILMQSYGNIEIICVDDNSTDNTKEILKEYQKKDPRIKILKNKNKKGVSGAMNTGLAVAQGKYITRMDSDDISLKDRIKKQVQFLENNSKYSLCSVNINFINVKDEILPSNHIYNNDIPFEWQYLWCNPLPCAPIMFRSESIGNIKFDEDLSTAEDYDFYSKLVDTNKFYILDEILYLYRLQSNSLSKSNFTLNNSLLVVKNYYKKITKKDPPLILYELTDFKDNYITNNVLKNLLFNLINETLEIFCNHFDWSISEYNMAKLYIYDRFGKKVKGFADNEYKEKYINILNSFSWKLSKPLRKVKTGLMYLKHYGIKKTVKKLLISR